MHLPLALSSTDDLQTAIAETLSGNIETPEECVSALRTLNVFCKTQMAPYSFGDGDHSAAEEDKKEEDKEIRTWVRRLQEQLSEKVEELRRSKNVKADWSRAREDLRRELDRRRKLVQILLERRRRRISRGRGHPFAVAALISMILLSLWSIVGGGAGAGGNVLQIGILILALLHHLRVFAGLTLLEHDPEIRELMGRHGSGNLVRREYSLKIFVLVSLAILSAIIGGGPNPLLWTVLWMHTVVLVVYQPLLRKVLHNETLESSNNPVILGNYGFLVLVFLISLANAPAEFFVEAGSQQNLVVASSLVGFVYSFWFVAKEFQQCYSTGVRILVCEIAAYLSGAGAGIDNHGGSKNVA